MAETTVTPVDGSGDNPTSTPSGISLTSLVPILERLGDAVCLKNGQYNFQSPISDEAWAAVQEFAQTIEELDLSNLGANAQGNSIADITFVQLAIHCRRQLGLLPFLMRLRVNNEGESHNLLFLPLVLSHRLETVEIIGITPGAGILVESFLSHSAAETLTRLVISSSTCLPSTAILQSCTNLRSFEINSNQYTPITPYLQGIISHPSIEQYEIVAGQDSFKGTPTKLTVQAIQETPQLGVIFSRRTWEVLELVDVPGFHPASAYLEQLSASHSLQQFELRTNSDTFTWTPPRLSIDIQHGLPYLSMITVWKDVGVLEVEDVAPGHPTSESEYLDILPLCTRLKEFRISCHRLQECRGTLGTSTDTDTTELIQTSYIDQLFIRTATLKTFFLPPLDIRCITIEHPVIVNFMFGDYDATRIMELIANKMAKRVEGLVFTSQSTYFQQPWVLLASPWPQLLELKLRINGTQDHLSLEDLKDLAQHCPRLSSLQVLVSLRNEPFSPPGGFRSCLLKHPLAHFSTGTAPSRSKRASRSFKLEPEVSAQVARYLCAIFPNVKITSHEGFQESVWNAIGEVIQICQAYQGDFVGQSGQTDGADER